MHFYLPREHVSSRIPCSITLWFAIRPEPAGEPNLVFTLKPATLRASLSLSTFEATDGMVTDPAILSLLRSWSIANRDVLLAVCDEEYRLARAILDIDLAVDDTRMTGCKPVVRPLTDRERTLIAAVKENMSLKSNLKDLPTELDELAREMNRCRAVAAHRRSYALGCGSSLSIKH